MQGTFFLTDQITELELKAILDACQWGCDQIVQDLILLFSINNDIQPKFNILNERDDLEANISYDAEEITTQYGLFDWHNIPGSDFPARSKDCSMRRKGGESGKIPSMSGQSRWKVRQNFSLA